jgi:hypothetical protein
MGFVRFEVVAYPRECRVSGSRVEHHRWKRLWLPVVGHFTLAASLAVWSVHVRDIVESRFYWMEFGHVNLCATILYFITY